VRIPCIIEWVGPRAGWQAVADYRGKPITVMNQNSFAAARKRLKAALVAAGAPKPELQITARMPKTVETDLERYRELAKVVPELTKEFKQLQIQLAQRLSTEFRFSERETGIWLGVSGAHISAKLRALTVDTGEFVRPSRDDDDDDDDEDDDAAEDDGATEPARPTVKSR
jgi:hypothetical protein